MKQIFKKIKKLSKKTYQPIFIMGIPRSGTTWVWGMLTSHPNIISLTREDFDPNKPSVINGKRITSETGAFVNFDKKFASKIIKNKIKKNRNKIIIEKTPSHALHIEAILNEFPNAKIIYILRDPRAVISSMLNSNFFKFAESVEDACNQYEKYITIYRNFKNNPSLLTVKYEKLIDDPIKEMTRVLNFIGADARYINKIIKENHQKTKVHLPGVLRKGRKDAYKEDLSRKQISYIERKMDCIIKEFYS